MQQMTSRGCLASMTSSHRLRCCFSADQLSFRCRQANCLKTRLSISRKKLYTELRSITHYLLFQLLFARKSLISERKTILKDCVVELKKLINGVVSKFMTCTELIATTFNQSSAIKRYILTITSSILSLIKHVRKQ